MNPADVERLARDSSWEGLRAVVVGFDGPGFAAADNLTHLGASVTALAEDATPAQLEQAELLEILGATVVIHSGATTRLPDDVDLVITSTALADDDPVLLAARARGLPVWGDVELAWRLRPAGPTGAPAPWLCVAGSGDLALTAGLLAAMLHASGLRPVVAGSGELPVVEAVMDPAPYDAFVLELTGAQLRHVSSTSPTAAVVIDVDPADPCAGDLGRVYEQVQEVCAYPVADPAIEELVREADVVDGARAIGYTAGMPAVGMLGVVEDLLVDRAFIPERASSAAELATLADLSPDAPPTPDVVLAALAAATLARAVGLTQVAVRDGLRGVAPPAG